MTDQEQLRGFMDRARRVQQALDQLEGTVRDAPPAQLTDGEINRLAELLRDSAQDKKRRARQAHPNDRPDMEAAAMRDYELRKKLISMKSNVQGIR